MADAPPFDALAPLVAGALRGTVAVAAHNARFDRLFLDAEFARAGHPLPDYFAACTMQLAGGGALPACCRDFGVPADGPGHHALGDARAAARLLVALLRDDPRAAGQLRRLPPVDWPAVPPTGVRPVTRSQARDRQAAPPGYLQRLLGRAATGDLPDASEGAVMAYAALLDRVLEDRRVDDTEADALVATAGTWGLTGGQVERVHRGYLTQLAVAAVADGVVTDAERRDLRLVCRLLGQDPQGLEVVLAEAAARLAEVAAPAVRPTGAGLSGVG